MHWLKSRSWKRVWMKMENKRSFEQGMQELEQLARALETGEMTLEDSFKAYERAVELKNALEKLLDEGDRRIIMLTQNGEEEISAEEIQ